MPARNWDKVRRESKAPRYDPIDSFRPRRFKRLSLRKPSPTTTVETSGTKPVVKKILQASAGSFIVYSTWIRKHNHWRCIHAQAPLEWFTRLIHPEVAQKWLLDNHFQYNWLDAKPDAGSNKASEETPADSYTANAPSHSPEVNTSPSQNNDTQAERAPCVTEVVKSPAAPSSCTGAEWLHHSSPLNAPAEQATTDSGVSATT